MNSPLIIQLIRLAEAPSGPQDQLLWDLIDSQPEVALRWQRLQLARQQLDDGNVSDGPLDLTPEELIEFLEDGLPDARIAEVEQKCWNSPAQLAELLSNYRFLNQPQVWGEPPATLTERCLHLAQPLPIAQSPPQAAPLGTEPSRSQPMEVDRGRNGHAVPGLWLADAQPMLPRRRRRSLRSRPTTIWVATISAVTAVVVLVVLLAFSQRKERSSDPELVQQSPSRSTPRPINSHRLPGPRSGNVELQNDDRSFGPPPEMPAPEWPADVESLPDSGEPFVVSDSPPLPETLPLPEKSVPFELLWTDIRGLLAASDGGSSGLWRGVDGKQSILGNIRLVTLPESWSTAEISSGGSLTMSGDTEISLGREDGPEQRLSILVHRGQVAVSGLSEGQQVHFIAGRHSWDARALRDYSSIAVSLAAETPLILVPQGEALANDVRLAYGQQASFSGEKLSDAQPLEQSPLWLSPPKTDWSKRRAALATLRRSTNVKHDLVRLFDKPESRQWATVWSLALNPEESLVGALGHNSRAVRNSALEVLRTVPRRDPRIQQLRQAMVKEFGAQGANTLLGWILASRNRALPEPAVRQSMLEGLTDRRLMVRHAAIFCLDQIYARPFPRMTPPHYEPEHWSRESVVAWGAYTNSIHELVDGRAQRRSPANQLAPRTQG